VHSVGVNKKEEGRDPPYPELEGIHYAAPAKKTSSAAACTMEKFLMRQSDKGGGVVCEHEEDQCMHTRTRRTFRSQGLSYSVQKGLEERSLSCAMPPKTLAARGREKRGRMGPATSACPVKKKKLFSIRWRKREQDGKTFVGGGGGEPGWGGRRK